MDFLISNLISTVVALIAATWILTRYFKGSVFVQIGIIWLINLLALMVLVGMKYKYFEQDRLINILITFANVGISLICFYTASIRVVTPLSKAVNNLQALSTGDLTIQTEIDDRFKNNDIGKLQSATKTLRENLVNIVKEIQDNAHELNLASDEFRQFSLKIAEATNEQAASIEEISSSIEEVTANIQQNLENAKIAEINAQTTSQNVLKSVNSSEKTKNLSNQINEKIKLISDIASQTNILALNAAIEAARAGESGKGFAVVAGEVRRLAERATKAAKEIEELSAQLNHSAEETAKRLDEAGPITEKNLSLLREIAATTQEQSVACEQVSNSVSLLNQTAQANASNAQVLEQQSLSLHQQAQAVYTTTNYFKLANLEKQIHKKQALKNISYPTAKKTPVSAQKSSHESKPVKTITATPQKATGIDLNLDIPDDSTLKNFKDDDFIRF